MEEYTQSVPGCSVEAEGTEPVKDVVKKQPETKSENTASS